MHNATDVAGGVLMGTAALVITVFAARAAGAAASERAAIQPTDETAR
jgi:hypothetical protein